MQLTLREQVDRATAHLTAKRIADRDVHQARKCIKKARATLRLLREALANADYRRINEALRDAARPLGARRDAAILIEVLQRVVNSKKDPDLRASAEALRRSLRRELRDVERSPAALANCRSKLHAESARIAQLRLPSHAWPVLGRGLKRTYARGRDACALARGERTDECLHEWRKQAKYLWHQLQLLQPLRPHAIGRRADQAHRLSNYLGDDHDLAVLRGKVFDHPGRSTASGLLAAIDKRRRKLQKQALKLGERLYKEKPGQFRDRLQGYWRQQVSRAD
jgi:CHAD domain-containing protein